MRWLVKAFWKTTVVVGTWFGILFLAKDFKELPDALQSWAPLVPNQKTSLIAFSGALVAWVLWTDTRPFVMETKLAKILRGEKHDPPDIVLAKRDLNDLIGGSLTAAYSAIHEAVRVGAYVFQTNWKGDECSTIAFWGVQSRIPDRSRLSVLLDKEKIRATQLEYLQDTLVEALARYRASCEMLNMVCDAMNRTGRYEDKRNYTQKDHKNFHDLVRDWWKIHKRLKEDLNKLAFQGRFFKTQVLYDGKKNTGSAGRF